MKEDRELIKMLHEIKPFLSVQYQNEIDERIKKLTPVTPKVEPVGSEKMIVCPECDNLICFDDQLEDLRDFYEFDSLYCGICGQSVDVSDIKVGSDDE